jgi:diaminopimelate decarboxylase
LGGGLGVDYNNPETHAIPDFKNFFDTIANTLDIPEGIKVHFELGRSLVAQCGKILTKVLYTKKGVNKDFVITDAGMTELMRPSLYQAKHKIKNVSSPYNEERIYDVVGPVCESSDVFDTNVSLAEAQRGDILAIESCGAYAESMSLNYNMRKKPVIYFLEGNTLNTKSDYVPEKQHL